MSSPYSWHGSWRRRSPGEALGVVEEVRLGLSEGASPGAPDSPAPARRHSQVTVVRLSQDVPGRPAVRACGRMWLGG